VTLRCAVSVQKPVASGFLPHADAIERYQLTIRTAGPALAVEGYEVTAVSEEQIAFHKAGMAFLLDRYTLEVEVHATDPPAGAAPNAGPRRGTCRRLHRQL
jgi:hypothetical protein